MRVDWNSEAAKGILSPALSSTEVEFRNANFQVSGSDLTVIPSQDGVEIDWSKTLDQLDAKLLDTVNRRHEVAYNERKATYTTDMAQKANFNDVMGTFTTGGYAGDSGVNIRRVAEQVNGAIVLPGETRDPVEQPRGMSKLESLKTATPIGQWEAESASSPRLSTTHPISRVWRMWHTHHTLTTSIGTRRAARPRSLKGRLISSLKMTLTLRSLFEPLPGNHR